MPYAFVLPLKPVNDASIPSEIGECVHAAFFALLRSADAELANSIHDKNERKPFTLCPLFAGSEKHKSVSVLEGIRVSLLDDSLFPVVLAALLAGTSTSVVRLGDAEFQPVGVLTNGGAHRLAGCVSYADLRVSAQPTALLSIEFCTPTVFRSQKRDVLWPEPRLIWQSWLRAWHQHAPLDVKLPEEAEILTLTESISIQNYRLWTHPVPLAGRPQEGFKGHCIYNLHELDVAAQLVLVALANYAFYAGTGRKTAMGMGQTNRVSLREASR